MAALTLSPLTYLPPLFPALPYLPPLFPALPSLPPLFPALPYLLPLPTLPNFPPLFLALPPHSYLLSFESFLPYLPPPCHLHYHPHTWPQISRCLQEIMKLCNTFSALLQDSHALVLTGREQGEVTRISEEFSRQASLFFDIVSGIKVHGCAPHLAQLLLRVDYNKYFSSSKHFMQTRQPH